VYFYRDDRAASSAALRVSIDGSPTGELLDGEYWALRLSPGAHSISLSLARFRWLPISWSRFDICARELEPTFVRFFTSYSDVSGPEEPVRDRAIPGTSTHRPKLEIFAARVTRENAREGLARCRRAPSDHREPRVLTDERPRGARDRCSAGASR
jgi:hypothetical protein